MNASSNHGPLLEQLQSFYEANAKNLLFFVAALAIGIISARLLRKPTAHPPGPPGSWLFGHTFIVPKKHAWYWFHELGKTYGPIIRLSMGGDNVIVLNDADDAHELLSKRSHNYSSRKHLVYAGDYLSNNKRAVLMPYNTLLKRQRQVFTQTFHPREAANYEPRQEYESRKFLIDMLDRPVEASDNVKRFGACMLMSVTYGTRVDDKDESLKGVMRVLDGFIHAVTPGAELVDAFPILDKLPNFLAPWRARGLAKHDWELGLYGRLVREVREGLKEGKAKGSFSARLWEQQEKMEFSEEDIAYAAGTSFEAGTGATSGTLYTVVLAAVTHPEVVKKAQEELDRVVGPETMPSFSHMQDLPYIRAIVKEALRWRPSIPNGFPHLSEQDDEYKGYKIPAGTVIIPNTWGMHQDEKKFPNPQKFDPDRFIDDPTSLVEGHFTFGFGRRVCPGNHLATRAVFITTARLLWGFNFGLAIDPKTGKEIPIDVDHYTSGITSEPEEFPLRAWPRSKAHEDIMRNEWAEAQAATA